MDYLPKDATIEEACNWLHAKTGQTWVLARLLECHLTPYFWLDYKPGYPAIYGNRIEGYQTRMMFQGDLCRLESDRGDALVNMFTAHDGTLVKVEPGLRVPLSELKFKRESVERVAEIINKTAPARSPATRAPVGTPKNRPTSQAPTKDEKPWLVADPKDPEASYHWYTPARYFARQLVQGDSTLLIKKLVLADKVSRSLANAGIYKRGGRRPHDAATVLKAFSNVHLG